MKEYWIETEPLQFLAIYDMQINVGINRHGIAHVSGFIADEWEERYISLLMQEIWITILAVDKDESRQIIFCGFVKSFQICKEKGQKSLKLELVSGTYLMDLHKHIRLFQDKSVFYNMIFKQIGILNNGNVQVNNSSLDMEIGKFIMQYEESDWEFLIRLLSGCQTFLVPEIRKRGINYSADFKRGREIQVDTNRNCTIKRNMEEYWEKKNAGMGIEEIDCLTCHIKERELFYLGDYLMWKGIKMYIEQIELSYVNGEIINYYQARTQKGMRTLQRYQNLIKGNSMMGTVIDVKEDKVRIKVMEDENAGNCIEKWFSFSTPYSSADGTGWYFMPEVGDYVRLYFPSKVEEDAYVISAVHMETNSGERSRSEYKILKNKQQKEIRFTPNSILLTNNKGMKIEMIDGEGIYIESDQDISIGAGESMNIISRNGSLILAADSALELNQGETSIQLEDGIQFMGGEFHVQ